MLEPTSITGLGEGEGLWLALARLGGPLYSWNLITLDLGTLLGLFFLMRAKLDLPPLLPLLMELLPRLLLTDWLPPVNTGATWVAKLKVLGCEEKGPAWDVAVPSFCSRGPMSGGEGMATGDGVGVALVKEELASELSPATPMGDKAVSLMLPSPSSDVKEKRLFSSAGVSLILVNSTLPSVQKHTGTKWVSKSHFKEISLLHTYLTHIFAFHLTCTGKCN